MNATQLNTCQRHGSTLLNSFQSGDSTPINAQKAIAFNSPTFQLNPPIAR
jgi:hypothetical protein